MSDLDDLAAAASPPAPRKPGAAARPTQPASVRQERDPVYEDSSYYPPPAVGGGGVDPKVWVWLGVGLVVLLGLAFWLINREPGGTTTPGAVAQNGSAAPAGAKPPTTAAAMPSGPAETMPSDGTAPPPALAPQAAPTAQTGPAARSGWGPLEDVEEAAEAIVVYHLERVATDMIEFKIRNKSKRGVFVRALEFFAESDDRLPLGESITFWLPPGGLVVDKREIAEMARRLGDDEGVTAVVQDAEFSDAEPEEIRALRTEADSEAEEAE